MRISDAGRSTEGQPCRWWSRLGKTSVMRAAWGVAVVLLTAPAAHAGFANGGFEDNNALPPTGWTLKTYTRSSDLPSSPPPPGATLAQLGLSNEAVGNGVSALVNLPVGNVPSTNPGTLTAPRWGDRAFKLNDQGAKQASSIEQTAVMTAADIDPVDHKIHVRFGMAPVLVDGGHSATQQPYFYVEVYNVTKGKVLFNTYNYANQSGVPWQTQGSYRYTDWQGFDVSPGNGQLDVGDSVKLIVYASNCSPGAAQHEARVYLDAVGAFMPGLTVAATGPSTTKPGEQVTYTYNYSNGSGAIALDSVVRVSAPKTEDGKYTTFDTGSIPPGCTTPPTQGEIINASTTPPTRRGDYVLCTVGTSGMLNDGQSGSFDMTFNVPVTASTVAPSNIVNNGDYNISASTVSPYIGPLVKTTIVPAATPIADLGVAMDNGGVVSYTTGSTPTYTMTVTNLGSTDVTGASVVQTISGLSGAGTWSCSVPGGSTASCGATSSGAGPVSTNTADIPAGQSLVYTYTGPAPTAPGTPVNSTVTVTPPAGTSDSNNANNTAGMSTPVSTSQQNVTANASGTGAGHILAVPGPLACGDASTACDTTGTTKAVGVGDEVRLTPVAHPGSLFTGWTGCTSLAGDVCVVAVAGGSDVTATAQFTKAYLVTPTLLTGGSMTPAVPKQVVDGDSTVYKITPDAGKTTYILPPPSGAACTGTLDTSGTPNTYTVTPVTADCGFTVAFSVEETSSVTGGNGTITPLGVTGPLVPGSNSTVYTLTPDAGYTPVVDGTCKGVFDGSVTPNTYTVTDATADCTVIASFTNDPVTVTSSTSGGHGSIDTTGTINLPNGGSRTYTFTPDAGYYPLVSGNCPGTLVGNTYTVSPVTANCAFNVTFSSTTVDITATVKGGVGTLTPPGTTTVALGGGQSYTATPSGGSVTVFEDSSTCPGVRSGNVYNVTGATANCAVNAKFVAAADAVTVTTTVPGGHGTVTTPGQDGTGNTVLAIGDVRTWTVTPDAGYVPQVQNSTCGGTLSATAPYTYTLTAATTCAVTFAFAPVAAGAASIPTLSEWGLIILSALVGLFMVGMYRRRVF